MEPHGTGVWFSERKMEKHFEFKKCVLVKKEYQRVPSRPIYLRYN